MQRYQPWLGDMFSFLYDRIMSRSIFPNKFKGSIRKHFEILREEFNEIHKKEILEIATGSGNAVEFLNAENHYYGTDISAGLLRIAARKFKKAGFAKREFYICDAASTPFKDNYFDITICNLSLNFFNDINDFISEAARVLKPGGWLFCSIALPELKKDDVKIRGTLLSEEELKLAFMDRGFRFESLDHKNGALLYFKAHLKE